MAPVPRAVLGVWALNKCWSVGWMDGRTDESTFPLGIFLPDVVYIFRGAAGGILLSLGSDPPQGSLPRNYVASVFRHA